MLLLDVLIYLHLLGNKLSLISYKKVLKNDLQKFNNAQQICLA